MLGTTVGTWPLAEQITGTPRANGAKGGRLEEDGDETERCSCAL